MRHLVTENLFHFLRFAALRSASGPWWIDAICINQDNFVERQRQVMMMTSIYAGAFQVFVWLGEEDVYTVPALKTIERIRYRPPIRAPSHDDNIEALLWFFGRSWFVRIWVIQESTLARQITFQCGSHSIARMTLFSVAMSFRDAYWLNIRGSHVPYKPNISGVKSALAVIAFKAAHAFRQDGENRSSFLTAILSCRQFRSSDPRDKIYGLLSLANQRATQEEEKVSLTFISPDYTKTIPEVYTKATKILLDTSKDLLILSTVVDGTYKEIPGLPSWVPDYSVTTTTGIWCGKPVGYSPALGMESYWRVEEIGSILSIRASKIATVFKTGESKHEMTHLNRGERLLNMVAGMDNAYTAGQSKIEALWKTLVEGSFIPDDSISYMVPYPSQYPEDDLELMRQRFRDWLLNATARWLLQDKLSATSLHPPTVSQDIMMSLEQLANSDGGQILYPVEEIRRFANLPDASQAQIIEQHNLGSYQLILDQIPHARFFTTEEGHMGMGPISLEVGDSIWLVPGAQIFFAFRARPSTDRYEFIGDCYVHGLMDGEAVHTALPTMEIIELE
ncbi:MAG: hypothetical protein Q9169_007262 [Polycauliona sp. 2 TL-2023]